MGSKKGDDKFDELMENLSDRAWHSKEGIVPIEEMSQDHINRVIDMIEGGNIDLMGLEDEYISMFKEELEDRDVELDFD
jgi:hypothetical protein